MTHGLARRHLLIAVVGLALAGCGDLLQEPETGAGPVPLRLEEVSGNGQTGTPGAALPEPVRVQVIDFEGRPAPGLWVEWSVLDGGGEVASRNTVSDESGFAETKWILGPAAGPQEIRATVVGGTPMVFDATAAVP